MSSSSPLLQAIGEIWDNDGNLTDLVPFDRMYTGLVPSTELKRFPYVSVLQGGTRHWFRTDKAQYSRVPVTFHIWVDDSDLATAEAIENQIWKSYANQTWDFLYGTIMDVIDEGPGTKHQINEPNYRAWEVVKLLTFCLMQERVD